MNKQIKIDLTSLLGTNYNNFGVIMTDHHPVITWNNPKHKRPIITNLWYPIGLTQIPATYTGYLREKLGVTNTAEALQIINDWNTQSIPTPRVVKRFNIGLKHFAALEIPEISDRLAVLGTYADRPKNYRSVGVGSGGYVWQWL